MAAPIGNQYWLKRIENGSQNGRPATLKDAETIIDKFNEYINYMNNDVIEKVDFVKSGPTAGQLVSIPCQAPYTLEGFCLVCGITTRRFNQIINDEKNKDIIPILLYVQEAIRNNQLKGGLVGTLNPMLVARINGLKEQQEIQNDVKNTVTYINFVQRSVEDTTYIEVKNKLEDD